MDVYESIFMNVTALPMPAHSAIDPVSGLSFTSWLFSQPADYQKLHMPVPYEQMSPVSSQLHPPIPDPG